VRQFQNNQSTNLSVSHYFFVRPKVDQIAGQLSLPYQSRAASYTLTNNYSNIGILFGEFSADENTAANSLSGAGD